MVAWFTEKPLYALNADGLSGLTAGPYACGNCAHMIQEKYLHVHLSSLFAIRAVASRADVSSGAGIAAARTRKAKAIMVERMMKVLQEA